MKKQTKENWVDETLNSLEGVQRPELPAGFMENALRNMNAIDPARMRVSRPGMWRAAAAITLLVTANVVLCLRNQKVVASAADQFARESFAFVESDYNF